MADLSIKDSVDAALKHHQAGRLPQAEQLYRQVLAREPDNVIALNYLGVIAHQMKQFGPAMELIGRALARNPNYAEAHFNLAHVYKDDGRLDEAVASFQRVLVLNPNLPWVHIDLGIVLTTMVRFDEAIAAYGRAIGLQPELAEAHSNLGNALRGSGRLEEAIAAQRKAISLKPSFTIAHYNLANALKEKGALKDAIAAYRQAIALEPKFAEAHFNLGCVLKDLDQVDEAISALGQAVSFNAGLVEAWYNLGKALEEKGNVDDCIAAYQKAIALRPEHSDAHNNLGTALATKGHMRQAIVSFRKAIELQPAHVKAYANLATTLEATSDPEGAARAARAAIALDPTLPAPHLTLGNAYRSGGLLDEAIAEYREALAIQPGYVQAQSNLVYTLYFHPGWRAKAIADEHRAWNRRHAEPLRVASRPHANDAAPDRRLRIGYVSPDFRAHPVGRFLLPLFANHDRRQFDIFAYSNSPHAIADAMTDSLRAHTDVWRSLVGLSDEHVAQGIRNDRVDILVDLSLHMAHHRLLVFAQKPAPVQVTYLAYAGTSGLTTMDYRLSDPYLDPPGEDESIYSEKTVRLPETYWCYQSATELPVAPPPALANGYVTFGCLNNFCKVNEPLLDVWIQVLGAFGQSQLLLYAHEGAHRQRTLEYLERRGIERGRVTFVANTATDIYFQTYQSIDIALDTFPYGGGTTTCDALWMGVPVVSLAGNTAVGRGGLSILSNIGLAEFVARTPDEYVRIAGRLANDLPRLAQLRQSLRGRMQTSPLMDGPRFARNVEAAYRRMWRDWCESE